MGFLPGDIKEKVDPYMRPLYDALQDMMPEGKLQQRIEAGQIEIAPLAYMRGRTLSNACVILDEAQNTTPSQMKMFLTRMGENSRMIVTGDPTQTDLPPGMPSGLADAVRKLGGIAAVSVVQLRQQGRGPPSARRRDHRGLRDGGATGRPTSRGDAAAARRGGGQLRYMDSDSSHTIEVTVEDRGLVSRRHRTRGQSAGGRSPPFWRGKRSAPSEVSVLLADDRAGHANSIGTIAASTGRPTSCRSPLEVRLGQTSPSQLCWATWSSPWRRRGTRPRAEGRPLADHLNHLMVHGTCICWATITRSDDEAREMEAPEVELLADLGVPDPYRPESRP